MDTNNTIHTIKDDDNNKQEDPIFFEYQDNNEINYSSDDSDASDVDSMLPEWEKDALGRQYMFGSDKINPSPDSPVRKDQRQDGFVSLIEERENNDKNDDDDEEEEEEEEEEKENFNVMSFLMNPNIDSDTCYDAMHSPTLLNDFLGIHQNEETREKDAEEEVDNTLDQNDDDNNDTTTITTGKQNHKKRQRHDTKSKNAPIIDSDHDKTVKTTHTPRQKSKKQVEKKLKIKHDNDVSAIERINNKRKLEVNVDKVMEKMRENTKVSVPFEKLIGAKRLNPDDIEALSNENVRNIFNSFIHTIGFLENQTEGFNYFMDKTLPHIIRESSEQTVVTNNGRYCHKVIFGRVTVEKPNITGSDGSVRYVYPKECTLRGLTYASNILCDVQHYVYELSPEARQCVIKKKNISSRDDEHSDSGAAAATTTTSATNTKSKFGGARRVYAEEKKKILKNLQPKEIYAYKECHIATLPIMIGSKYCHLYKNPYLSSQCPHDTGGYFIVDGSEKVVLGHEYLRHNRPYVFKSKSSNTNKKKWSYSCEIRSLYEGHMRSTSTLYIYLMDGKRSVPNDIRIQLPFVNTYQVPLCAMFRVLHVNSKQAMYDLIMNGITERDNPKLSVIANEVIRSDQFDHMTRDDILTMIGREGIKSKNCADEQHRMANHILTYEFLPHLGMDTNAEVCFSKATYLGMVVCNLLRCYLGQRKLDDKDHYSNKYIATAGELLALRFRQLYRRFIKNVGNHLQKNATDHGQNMDLVEVLNYKKITSQIKYALATGHWGVKKKGSNMQGVAQVMNRMTYLSALSHLRRVNNSLNREGKISKPRQIDGSQRGELCCVETPEGDGCGLVKNLALMVRIRLASSSKQIKSILCHFTDIQLFSMTLMRARPEIKNTTYLVMLNGTILGYVEDHRTFVATCRRLRRCQNLPMDCSIYYNQRERLITIDSESGCGCRPVFVVENLHLLPDLLRQFGSKPELLWRRLLVSGVIEYVDRREEMCLRVALNPNDLLEPRYQKELSALDQLIQNQRQSEEVDLLNTDEVNGYTHLEICVFSSLGVCSSLIPFSNHNPAPRNTYSCSMTKQAIGLTATNNNTRMDTVNYTSNYIQKAMVRTWLENLMGPIRDLSNGVNLIVAIAMLEGFNQEDSIIVNEASIDRGALRSIVSYTFREDEKMEGTDATKIEKPDPNACKILHDANYDTLDPTTGVVPLGHKLRKGDVVIGKTISTAGLRTQGGKSISQEKRDKSTVLMNKNGLVNAIMHSTNKDGQKSTKVRLSTQRIPKIGDKMCLTADHEVLSKNRGWISIDRINYYDEIMTAHTKCKRSGVYKFTFQTPKRIIRDNTYEGSLYYLESDALSMVSTENHKHWVSVGDDDNTFRSSRFQFKTMHDLIQIQQQQQHQQQEKKKDDTSQPIYFQKTVGENIDKFNPLYTPSNESFICMYHMFIAHWVASRMFLTSLNDFQPIVCEYHQDTTLCVSIQDLLFRGGGEIGGRNQRRIADIPKNTLIFHSRDSVRQFLQLYHLDEETVYRDGIVESIVFEADTQRGISKTHNDQHTTGKDENQHSYTLYTLNPNRIEILSELQALLIGKQWLDEYTDRTIMHSITMVTRKFFAHNTHTLLPIMIYSEVCRQFNHLSHSLMDFAQHITTTLLSPLEQKHPLKYKLQFERDNFTHQYLDITHIHQSYDYEMSACLIDDNDGGDIKRSDMHLVLEQPVKYRFHLDFIQWLALSENSIMDIHSRDEAYWHTAQNSHTHTLNDMNDASIGVYQRYLRTQFNQWQRKYIANASTSSSGGDDSVFENRRDAFFLVQSRNRPVINNNCNQREKNFFQTVIPHYKGSVYCVEVPYHHLFYVRRNGRCFWTGNSSRHGQKNTIGRIVPDVDMPFSLESGTRPDLIINPHAFPKRMTIGHIIEGLLSKAAATCGEIGDGTPFFQERYPDADEVVEEIGKILHEHGYQSEGLETMCSGITGEIIQNPVFISPMFYERLKHMVDDKYHARARGPVQALTRQPTEGKSRDGGLRFGEMENDAGKSHGSSSFLKERLFDQSDPYQVFVCDRCGYFADPPAYKKQIPLVQQQYNQQKMAQTGIDFSGSRRARPYCRMCESSDRCILIKMPFAEKLFMQEQMALHISPQIKLQDIGDYNNQVYRGTMSPWAAAHPYVALDNTGDAEENVKSNVSDNTMSSISRKHQKRAFLDHIMDCE